MHRYIFYLFLLNLQLSKGHLAHTPLLDVIFPLWKCAFSMFQCITNHFVLINTQILRHFILMFYKHVQQTVLSTQQCDLKTFICWLCHDLLHLPSTDGDLSYSVSLARGKMLQRTSVLTISSDKILRVESLNRAVGTCVRFRRCL